MNSFRWIVISTLVLSAILCGAAGCGSSAPEGVPQEDYDAVKNELADCKNQLVQLLEPVSDMASDAGQESALLALEADYAELTAKYEQLQEQAQSADTTGQLKALQDAYDELDAEYTSLQEQCETLAGEVAGSISEDDISQAILKLINEDRQSAGLPQLAPGPNLLKLARSNSLDMSEQGDYLYSNYPGVWQKILITAEHSSVTKISESALKIWKTNILKYENTVLSASGKYGAVGVVELDGVYYVTFMAATFR